MSCKCENKRVKKYNEDYDAYYCNTCKEWLDRKCGYDDCDFCVNRPDKAPEIE